MDHSTLTNYLDSLEKCGIPGCGCMIYLEHRCVFRHTAGYADFAKKKAMTLENTYWLYSATKLITCTAVMQLAENGSLGLDDPVSDYLPEYGNLKVKNGDLTQPARNAMTIRHLLSMQSGLNFNLSAPAIQKALKDSQNHATTRQIIKALAEQPLDFEPGSHYQYRISHDVLGAVIEAASGQRFSQYLDEHIFKPLGMQNTGFALTPVRKANMADQFEVRTDPLKPVLISPRNCSVLSEEYESGGAGLISTVEDYSLFLDAMCNGGAGHNGCRILSSEWIDRMRTNQLSEVSQKDFDLMGKTGYGYGLGVRTLIEKGKSGARSPLGEFGWDGAAGAYALVDVKNHLAIFYAQHVLGCSHAYSAIHPKIRDLTYETLGIDGHS